MSTLRRLVNCSTRHCKRLILVSLSMNILAAFSAVLWPSLVGELIDALLGRGSNTKVRLDLVGVFCLFVLRAVTRALGSYLQRWVADRVTADLRIQMYRQLHHLPLESYFLRSATEAISRLVNDIGAARVMVVDTTQNSIYQLLVLCGSAVAIFHSNARLAVIILSAMPVAGLVSHIAGLSIERYGTEIQTRLAQMSVLAQQAILSIMVVRACSRQNYEIERFRRATEGLFESCYRMARWVVVTVESTDFLFCCAIVGIFWVGTGQVLDGHLTTGVLITSVFYGAAIANSTSQLAAIYSETRSASGALKRVFEIIDAPVEKSDRLNDPSPLLVNRDLRFDAVEFRFSDRTILHNISFEVKHGDSLALVGRNGAGKSTILNLIPRFFEPSAGQIFVDGRDVRSLPLKSLREQISLVPQETVIFNATLLENVRYGKPEAPDSAVRAACSAAGLDGFVHDLSDAYDTLLGEYGWRLSGGEKQKISLARAFLRNAPILLLDEPTSALDSESEKELKEVLPRLMDGRTTIIVGHRTSLIDNAQQVVLLDRGRIIERATRREQPLRFSSCLAGLL
jgi:subfamily B ATP-binding cassette protein MsbA